MFRSLPVAVILGLPLALPRPAHAQRQDTTVVYRAISAGAMHTCALSVGGQAYCWGNNLEGELGTGDNVDVTAPAAVTGGIRFLTVEAGLEFTCGLATTGEAYCWGRNDTYALGNASMKRADKPVLVSGGVRFRAVAVGGDHACGVAVDGVAYCWGSNSEGQLGTGDTLSSALPLPVAGSLRFRRITAGDNFTCGLTVDSLAYCWGGNRHGQLGTGRRDEGLTPQAVAYHRHWRMLSAGARHTCGLTAGRVPAAYCWGDNFHGQGDIRFRGQGGLQTRATLWAPTFVMDGSDLARVSAGRWHTCFVWRRSVDTVRCIGANFDGQLGRNLFGVYVQVSAGDAHTCGLLAGGSLYCWGRNTEGQLGDGTHFRRLWPVEVSEPLALTP